MVLQSPNENLKNGFSLQRLGLRRDIAGVVTLFKVINGYFLCPELLAEVNIFVAAGTGSTNLFDCLFMTSQCDYSGPLAHFLFIGKSRLVSS